MTTAWVAVVVAVLGLASTLATAIFTLRGKRPEQRTADWSQFTTAIQAWTATQLAEQEKRTADALATRDRRIGDLEGRVNELSDQLAALRGKYRAAISYVRYLVGALRDHVPPGQIAAPPIEISEDV